MAAANSSMTPFMLRDGVLQGHRFCIHHAPAGEARAVVLHAHALAHEMHFARPTSARAARALAAAGFAVLQIDLLGCGDSSGEFEDASFEVWQQDLRAGAAWLQAQHPGRPLWLWAERAAVLWAVGAFDIERSAPTRHLLWHPQTKGSDVLRQLLRTELPAAMERGLDAKQLRLQAEAAWAQGQAFALGGYPISDVLAQSLSTCTVPANGRDTPCIRIDPPGTSEAEDARVIRRVARGASPWLGQGLQQAYVDETIRAVQLCWADAA